MRQKSVGAELQTNGGPFAPTMGPKKRTNGVSWPFTSVTRRAERREVTTTDKTFDRLIHQFGIEKLAPVKRISLAHSRTNLGIPHRVTIDPAACAVASVEPFWRDHRIEYRYVVRQKRIHRSP